MKEDTSEVVIPSCLDVLPEQHEIDAAWIIAKHYKSVVEFLRPTDGYMVKTPDIQMGGILWEMKSPVGKSKTTIEAIIRKATKQSKHIIIDCRRTALDDEEIEKKIRFEISKRHGIKKVLIITKSKIVVEIA